MGSRRAVPDRPRNGAGLPSGQHPLQRASAGILSRCLQGHHGGAGALAASLRGCGLEAPQMLPDYLGHLPARHGASLSPAAA